MPNQFYSAEKYQYLTKYLEDRTQGTDKIPRKYQEIWNRNTKYHRLLYNIEKSVQIPIWYWYFLGIPNFWLPVGITNRDVSLGGMCCILQLALSVAQIASD